MIVRLFSTADLRRSLRTLALCSSPATALLLSSCASNGPPKPPSLNLPQPVSDLQAERIGNSVHLTWTTPTNTTDNVPVRHPLTVEVCRDRHPASRLASPCTVVQRLPVASGPTSVDDPLPPGLLAEPVVALDYSVRLLNVAGRSAASSNLVLAAAGFAPPPVTGLRGVPAAGGNRLRWDPQSSIAAAVLLSRSPEPSPGAPAPVPSPSVLARPGKRTHASAAVRLLAAPQGADPGGTLDPSAALDQPFRYTAWRSRTVTVAGTSLTLRSPDSPPALLQFHDSTPPSPPAALQGIADSNAVDLSWEPNLEPDLAGYWIERAPGSAAGAPSSEAWQRLNQTPVLAPAYRDASPARIARYRVLAVDATGNLSLPSEPISVSLPSSQVP